MISKDVPIYYHFTSRASIAAPGGFVCWWVGTSIKPPSNLWEPNNHRVHSLNTVFQQWSISIQKTLLVFFSNRECSKLFGEDGMTLKLFVKRTAPFSILWTLTNYLYLLALKKLTATDVSALYCCHKAFVFLLSWIVLKDRFMGVRVCMKTRRRLFITSLTQAFTTSKCVIYVSMCRLWLP